VQIVYKPVDLSKVTSKCGSLGNIHHKPGIPWGSPGLGQEEFWQMGLVKWLGELPQKGHK
jgi:hypothetical protein